MPDGSWFARNLFLKQTHFEEITSKQIHLAIFVHWPSESSKIKIIRGASCKVFFYCRFKQLVDSISQVSFSAHALAENTVVYLSAMHFSNLVHHFISSIRE